MGLLVDMYMKGIDKMDIYSANPDGTQNQVDIDFDKIIQGYTGDVHFGGYTDRSEPDHVRFEPGRDVPESIFKALSANYPGIPLRADVMYLSDGIAQTDASYFYLDGELTSFYQDEKMIIQTDPSLAAEDESLKEFFASRPFEDADVSLNYDPNAADYTNGSLEYWDWMTGVPRINFDIDTSVSVPCKNPTTHVRFSGEWDLTSDDVSCDYRIVPNNMFTGAPRNYDVTLSKDAKEKLKNQVWNNLQKDKPDMIDWIKSDMSGSTSCSTLINTALKQGKSTLLIRLAGSSQSWGTAPEYEAKREPTKKGIVELLARALGRDMEDDISDLCNLRLGARIDQNGSLRKEDFYEVDDLTGEKLEQTVYYLDNAVFLVGLESEDEKFLEDLLDALRHPKKALLLGRNDCIPSLPIVVGIRHADLETALSEEHWQATAYCQKNYGGDVIYLRLIMDSIVNERTGTVNEITGIRKDLPNQYLWRAVVEKDVPVETPNASSKFINTALKQETTIME